MLALQVAAAMPERVKGVGSIAGMTDPHHEQATSEVKLLMKSGQALLAIVDLQGCFSGLIQRQIEKHRRQLLGCHTKLCGLSWISTSPKAS